MTMKKQSGFVSIIVAAVLMILLSLITIGFTRLMQREQRQALDRQLSTQAFYAAETAVNDVRAKIQAGTIVGDEKVGCDVSNWPDTGLNGRVDVNTPTVTYTCLEYDRTPLDLVFTDTITTNSSRVFPVETGPAIASVRFKWTGQNGIGTVNPATDSCPTPTELPATFANNTVPMLRIDLIETPNAGVDITRDDLINRTATMYLFPKSTCGSVSGTFTDYIGDSAGRVVDVRCVPLTTGCTFDVTLPDTNNRYIARIKSVYDSVGTLQVTARDTVSNQLELKNAQVLVDATGKANDVLRRIEVRLSSLPDYNWPEAVVESSEGLCKLLQVAPDATNPTVAGSNCYNP
jgi:type II secretory pathway pseudopilin PulG